MTAANTPSTQSTQPRKVIYDTDPGVDDAMALYFALAHPGIELVGITTTFGNVTVEQATVNALYLTQLSGHDIPVTRGVDKPWAMPGKPPPTFIHGDDGLGNLGTRQPSTRQRDPRSSAQFIVDMARAHPGEITLVPVGPLGNLALALKLEPELPKLIREVVLMGGTVIEPGNVSPVAEANIWNDPHAADLVFTADWPLTMVGLDVTHQLILPGALFDDIAAHHRHPATDALRHAVSFYADFYSKLYAHVGAVRGCYGHDVLAFIRLVAPELFTTLNGRIRVTTDGIGQGQTMMHRRGDMFFVQPGWGDDCPVSTACLTVDAEAAKALFVKTLMSPWLPAAPKP
jgi:inosine-uridine nucleoside N-ribohydrolase